MIATPPGRLFILINYSHCCRSACVILPKLRLLFHIIMLWVILGQLWMGAHTFTEHMFTTRLLVVFRQEEQSLPVYIDWQSVFVISLLPSRHTVACCIQWMTAVLQSVFWISAEVVNLQHSFVVTYLVPREIAAISAHFVVFTVHPCTSLVVYEPSRVHLVFSWTELWHGPQDL